MVTRSLVEASSGEHRPRRVQCSVSNRLDQELECSMNVVREKPKDWQELLEFDQFQTRKFRCSLQ